MQDRIAGIDETSCTARPDHTFGSFATVQGMLQVRPGPQCPVCDGGPEKGGLT
jgi:hypothetical protein